MSRLRVAVWSPLPPSSSGIADHVAEALPALGRHLEVTPVAEEPAEPPPADLDLYHLGNNPAHAYVYRAALRRPGVLVLHEWSLHHVVLWQTVEAGDVPAYLREMRRSHGELGTYVGRQVARALGGPLLPALFAVNQRVLEGSLAVVGYSEQLRARAARALPGRPVLHLPHHLWLPLEPPPGREEARRALGLALDRPLLVAPGLATRTKRLDVAIRALARLRERHPSAELVAAGEADPRLPIAEWARAAGVAQAVRVTGRLEMADFERYLAAADLVLTLRFPTYGEISGALVRALGVGRPALVTAGTPPAEEFPDGVVVPVDPGPYEEDELVALADRLLSDPALSGTIGRLARDHVRRVHDLEAAAERLAEFLQHVARGKERLLAEIQADRVADRGLLGYFMEEVRAGARDLGLAGAPLGLRAVLSELAGEER